jgi:hypothetical protein
MSPNRSHRPSSDSACTSKPSAPKASSKPDTKAAPRWPGPGRSPAPRLSPVTLTAAAGRPPTRAEIEAEAEADPEGSTAPPSVPSGYCDQIGEARHILTWLIGTSDAIPLDDDHRGRLIGARHDYARTDAEIRHVRDHAAHSLSTCDSPDLINPADAARP